MGSLNVSASIDGENWDLVWTRYGDQGSLWQTAYVAVNPGEYSTNDDLNTTYYWLRFYGTTGYASKAHTLAFVSTHTHTHAQSHL